jgi:uncharacterized protein
LIEAFANIDLVDNRGRSALIHAAMTSSRVQYLLINAGANVHLTDEEGQSALDYSSMNGDLDVTRLLIEVGAKIEQANEGRSALISAIKGGHAQLAEQYFN